MAEKSPSLATQAYETIKENIMNLTYPPGMVLTEAMLTKELGMSRSPVRTAIQMLQVEGLIVSDYYKSMTVKEITEKDINEIYQLRELLEGPAFHLIFTSGRYEEYSYRIERSCACAPLPVICTNGKLRIPQCIWRLSVFWIMNGLTGSMKIIFPN